MAHASLKAFAFSSLIVVTACGREPARDHAVEDSGVRPAIAEGVVTGDYARNVGTLVYNVNGVWHWFCCGGTLVHPRVFVTAGHCIANILTYAPAGARVGVSFVPKIDISADPWGDPPLPADAVVYAGTPILHPRFDMNLFFDSEGNWLGEYSPNADVGIVLFDKPVRGMVPAAVAPQGTLDLVAKVWPGMPVGLASYGLSWDCDLDNSCPNVLPDPDWATRRYGTFRFQRLTPSWAVFQDAPSDVSDCDSGGPFFPSAAAVLGRMVPPRYVPMVLATVTGYLASSELAQCHDDCGASIGFRMDTALAHEFLDQYLHVPVH